MCVFFEFPENSGDLSIVDQKFILKSWLTRHHTTLRKKGVFKLLFPFQNYLDSSFRHHNENVAQTPNQ